MSHWCIFDWHSSRPKWFFKIVSAMIEPFSTIPMGVAYRDQQGKMSRGFAATMMITYRGYGFCICDIVDDDGCPVIHDCRPLQGFVVGKLKFVKGDRDHVPPILRQWRSKNIAATKEVTANA